MLDIWKLADPGGIALLRISEFLEMANTSPGSAN